MSNSVLSLALICDSFLIPLGALTFENSISRFRFHQTLGRLSEAFSDHPIRGRLHIPLWSSARLGKPKLPWDLKPLHQTSHITALMDHILTDVFLPILSLDHSAGGLEIMNRYLRSRETRRLAPIIFKSSVPLLPIARALIDCPTHILPDAKAWKAVMDRCECMGHPGMHEKCVKWRRPQDLSVSSMRNLQGDPLFTGLDFLRQFFSHRRQRQIEWPSSPRRKILARVQVTLNYLCQGAKSQSLVDSQLIWINWSLFIADRPLDSLEPNRASTLRDMKDATCLWTVKQH